MYLSNLLGKKCPIALSNMLVCTLLTLHARWFSKMFNKILLDELDKNKEFYSSLVAKPPLFTQITFFLVS